MTFPADAGASPPAHRDGDSGLGMKTALGVAVFILVVEFVLPGFLAAGFSRAGSTIVLEHSYWWDSYTSPAPAHVLAELIILVPPTWLMQHSQCIRRFYLWQYRRAGGFELDTGG